MKFVLSTSRGIYSGDHPEMVALRADLGGLGFTFDDSLAGTFIRGRPELELAGLDDLVEFCKKWGQVVIDVEDGRPSLEIYNGYRE
jgi:hypothetical protein